MPRKQDFKLSESAQKLWDDVTSKYDFEPHETALLKQACQAQTRIDELEEIVNSEGLIIGGSQGDRTHPALVEARQQRAVLARILGGLRLDDDGRQAQRNKPRSGGLRAVR